MLVDSVHLSLLIVAGVFTILTVIWSVFLVGGHLMHFNKPEHQKYIVRIIFMPAIYALNSWLSLLFQHDQWAIFIDIIRDCYEAYVIYAFFKLLVCFLGGKEAVNSLASSKPSEWKYPAGNAFYRRCLQGVLQYVFIKPGMAILAAILEACGVYGDGQFNKNHGYLYITIVNNISVCIALYYLALFYDRFRTELNPHKPILKFLVIKGVIFFTFWQMVAIMVAGWLGWIPATPHYSATTVSYFINDFLVCVEMFFAAIAHVFAFPYSVYRTGPVDHEGLFSTNGHRRSSVIRHKIQKVHNAMPLALEALGQVSNQRDIMIDTMDSVHRDRDFAYQKFRDNDNFDNSEIYSVAETPTPAISLTKPIPRVDSFSIIQKRHDKPSKNVPAEEGYAHKQEKEQEKDLAQEHAVSGADQEGGAVLSGGEGLGGKEFGESVLL